MYAIQVRACKHHFIPASVALLQSSNDNDQRLYDTGDVYAAADLAYRTAKHVTTPCSRRGPRRCVAVDVDSDIDTDSVANSVRYEIVDVVVASTSTRRPQSLRMVLS